MLDKELILGRFNLPNINQTKSKRRLLPSAAEKKGEKPKKPLQDLPTLECNNQAEK